MSKARHKPLGVATTVIGVALSVCFPADGHPQEVGRVTGTVLTTIRGGEREAVSGVTVHIPTLGLSSLSDEAGRFALASIPAGPQEIRADLIGCLLGSREIEVVPGRTVDVEFVVRRPAIRISGLVVESVGPEPTEQERSYSVETVEPVEGRGRRSIADIIRGAFPGVRVLSQSGLAGEEISIQLRGPTSITGRDQPLVVVDGIITAGGVVDLNPSDVAEVRVLKGAGAAAEYGARGAAGVIEITTRGVEPRRPGTTGPIVVIDGAVSDVGLSAIDTEDIIGTQLFTGTRAMVLFGPEAPGTGVLWITSARGGRAPEPHYSCAQAPR